MMKSCKLIPADSAARWRTWPRPARSRRSRVSVGNLDQHRLMIRSIGRRLDLDAADAGREVFGHEDKIAAIRAFGPLRVIVQAAGRIVRAIRIAKVPGVAIVQAGPRCRVSQGG